MSDKPLTSAERMRAVICDFTEFVDELEKERDAMEETALSWRDKALQAQQDRDEAIQQLDGWVDAERQVRGMRDDAERKRDEALAAVKRLSDREAHFARVLAIADGGRHQTDLGAAIERVVRERNEAIRQRDDLGKAIRHLGVSAGDLAHALASIQEEA